MIKSGLLVASILFLVISPCYGVLQISQGSIVYMNETLDISQAVSWPKFQLAWCLPNNSDCDPPDLVIDASDSNLEKYWIDPAKFKYGKYYRWDGEWHAAENAKAFTVIPGKRPTPNLSANNTTEEPGIIPVRPEGPFHYIVARGDSAILTSHLNEPDNCHLWLFTNTDATYDMPMSYEDGNFTTKLNSTTTYALTIGKSLGYIQCHGYNNWQDIYYHDKLLDTPYDNKIVPDLPTMYWNTPQVKRQFDELIGQIPKFDDLLYPVTIEVVDPTITITDVEQDEDTLFVSGVTTWSKGTAITLQLDPENYPIKRERDFHTWQTFAVGDIDSPRTFNTELPFDRTELSIGNHEIEMKADSTANTAVSAYSFKISDVYVMPTPTPAIKRMVYGKDYENIPIKIPPTPEPTPNVTEEIDWEEFIVITPEPIPTPNTTYSTLPMVTNTSTPLPSVPTANQTIPTIPISYQLGVIATISAIVIRRLK